jgi:ATP-dependent Clp protease adaptor protein ClpS
MGSDDQDVRAVYRAFGAGADPDGWDHQAVTATPVEAPVEAPADVTDAVVVPARPWVTIVWNDPVNLMDYVTHVFRTYFGYPREECERLMLAVHNEGRAVVSNGSREEMERDVEAMHGYGLWATLQQDD